MATPAEIAQAVQEMRDAKAREAATRAYNAASSVAPRPAASEPVVRRAKGGSVGSASKRADGIAMRGKTKGTMVTMCGGGYSKGKK